MILSEESGEEDLQSSLPLKPIDTNSNSNCVNSEKSNNSSGYENTSNQTTEPISNNKSSAENIEQKLKNYGKRKIKSLKVDPDYDIRLFK